MVENCKKICQLYMPAFYRSFGNDAIEFARHSLRSIRKIGNFDGVCLIDCYEGGGYNKNNIDSKFGSNGEFNKLISEAHHHEMIVGVNVIFDIFDKDHFKDIFFSLKEKEIDFVYVSHRNIDNLEKFVSTLQKVSCGLTVFVEWFAPLASETVFYGLPNCYALDCSFMKLGKILVENWDSSNKLIPLVGGHNQMTLADRGMDKDEILPKMYTSEYAFLDIQTLVGYKTAPTILQDDIDYNDDLFNDNHPYRGRRAIQYPLQMFINPDRDEESTS